MILALLDGWRYPAGSFFCFNIRRSLAALSIVPLRQEQTRKFIAADPPQTCIDESPVPLSGLSLVGRFIDRKVQINDVYLIAFRPTFRQVLRSEFR
jgi:hypothetical protein